MFKHRPQALRKYATAASAWLNRHYICTSAPVTQLTDSVSETCETVQMVKFTLSDAKKTRVQVTHFVKVIKQALH